MGYNKIYYDGHKDTMIKSALDYHYKKKAEIANDVSEKIETLTVEELKKLADHFGHRYPNQFAKLLKTE